LDSKCLFDKPVITYKINLDSLLELIENKAYIGFTASTGNAVERCELVKWTLYNDSSFVNSVENNDEILNQDNKSLYINNITINNEVLQFNLSQNISHNLNTFITDLEFYDYAGKLIFKQDDIKLNIGKNIIKISEKFTNLHNPIFISFNIKETNEVYNFKLLINE